MFYIALIFLLWHQGLIKAVLKMTPRRVQDVLTAPPYRFFRADLRNRSALKCRILKAVFQKIIVLPFQATIRQKVCHILKKAINQGLNFPHRN